MASYTFSCSECEHMDTERGVPMDDRDAPRDCPECGAELTYRRDVVGTLRAQAESTVYHEDLISILERRFGSDPNFTPPTSGGPEGRSRAGAGRSLVGDPRGQKKWY